MNVILNDLEVRVLGALVEKEITTPDYYPLSLNALVNACNQKSNRHPVMALDENAVRDALESLNAKGLAGAASGADSRVTKYEHRLQEAFNFSRPEVAILCVLLLRGPQTPGELRGRSERLYSFSDLGDVQLALQRLMKREPPLIKMLARQPGTKEARYAHLLAGEVETWEPEPATEIDGPSGSADSERLAHLEDQVANLQKELADLKQQLADFRKLFE
ncbi:MAG: YceH family protein [Acidobacteriia bacterium]|nr:YceH family protein [Terriglobia bacterium]